MVAKKSRKKERFSYSRIDIESIFIILQLLDGKKYTVKELIEKLNKLVGDDKDMTNMPYNWVILALDLNDDIGNCNDVSIGRSLKKLKKYNIVEKNERETSRSGGDPKEWGLIPAIDTLELILDKLYMGDLDVGHSRVVGYEILNSNYGKNLINPDLVKNKLKYLEYTNQPIKKNELDLILTIIRMSPRSLLTFLSISEGTISFSSNHPDKEYLLTNLISNLGDEIIGGGLPIRNPIQYKIEVNFNPNVTLQPNIVQENGFIKFKRQNYSTKIKTDENEIESIISYEKANLV